MVKTTIENYGKIDILVNSAGIVLPSSIYDLKLLETFNKLVETNLTPIIILSQLTVPYLEKTKGVIVNVSSGSSAKPSLVSNAFY